MAKNKPRQNLKPNGRQCQWCGDELTGSSPKYCSSKRCAETVYQYNKTLKKQGYPLTITNK